MTKSGSDEMTEPRIFLRTKDGDLVAEVRDLSIKMMVTNSAGPDVLVWGDRHFQLNQFHSALRDEGQVTYVEAFAVTVLEAS